jgi:hypothetical protein
MQEQRNKTEVITEQELIEACKRSDRGEPEPKDNTLLTSEESLEYILSISNLEERSRLLRRRGIQLSIKEAKNENEISFLRGLLNTNI